MAIMVRRYSQRRRHVYKKQQNIQKLHKFGGYLTIAFPSFTLFSVYLSPNITRENYRDKLEKIMENVRRCQSEKIIAGDSNAKLAEWGSRTTDARGTLLVRRATKSFIDGTLASQKI
ncbi:hypothetical protein JTB14_001587 [Gonioctena quinquepunctata]|nr:hypothetical protein JTB14_001587 [Gonioctena quinquepunctata]